MRLSAIVFATHLVIPGLGEAESPESMNARLWNMDSGLCPPGSPGMTSEGLSILRYYDTAS
jgi:hypothetical protein